MYIKDTWLRLTDTAYINLYWFIENRNLGLYRSEYDTFNTDKAPSENIIDLRDINGDGVTILYKDGTKFFLKTTNARIVLTDIEIAVDDNYEIETDLDAQLEKLSKRMSLLGQDCKYITDGVSIIEHSDRERAADIHKNEIHVEWTEYRKVISQYIDGYDFVSLTNCDTKVVHLKAQDEVKLRYLCASDEHTYITLDPKIIVEQVDDLRFNTDSIKQVHRIITGTIRDGGIYDLSKVEFINYLDIYGDKDIELDFGDNYINLSSNALCLFCDSLTIRYKNDHMTDILNDIVKKNKGIAEIKLIKEN